MFKKKRKKKKKALTSVFPKSLLKSSNKVNVLEWVEYNIKNIRFKHSNDDLFLESTFMTLYLSKYVSQQPKMFSSQNIFAK